MDSQTEKRVLVVGAGLAGSDAAWFLASRGIPVVLMESKQLKPTPAQKLKTCAELVCTNSLKSNDPDSAHGILKGEMEALGSLIMKEARKHAVPAGGALAVDRELFSQGVQKALEEHPLVEMVSREVEDPLKSAQEYGCQEVIVATGPLTLSPLEKWIQAQISGDDFYFYDAIAPVVDADSLDLSILYYKDRHGDEGEELADHLNVPLNKEQYEKFIAELVRAEKVPPQNFEEMKYFESCLPIDTMAERGLDTPRHSCMRPVGLQMADGTTPYAVVQLRKENLLGSAYNLVGFQTRLTYKEQLRVFRMLPGFQEATFIHLGSVHRNSFLNARKLLEADLSAKEFPQLYFAGQITGVEGYTESAAMGLYVAWQIWRRRQGHPLKTWPVETAIGALINYLMTLPKPIPSNINFGLLPSVTLPKGRRKRHEKKALKKSLAAQRAREALETLKGDLP